MANAEMEELIVKMTLDVEGAATDANNAVGFLSSIEEEINELKESLDGLGKKEEEVHKIDLKQIRDLLNDSFSSYIYTDIIKKERVSKLEDFNSEIIINPLFALDKYLLNYTDIEKENLMHKAKEMLDEVSSFT